MSNKKMSKAVTAVIMVIITAALALLVIADILHKSLRETDKYSVAMGTVITQRLFSENDAAEECESIHSLINELEDEISWRKENSVIYSLNKNYSTACDEEMTKVINLCQSVYEASDGAFDITVGKLTTLWNIGEDNARIPSADEIKKALKLVDGSAVKTEEKCIEIKKGQFVDLGAVGKGLACDRVRGYLENTTVSGAIVSVGGSILLYGDSEYSVAIRDPRGESDEYMGVLSLSDCCVSTSGDYERVLEKNGKRYHHILDSHTGYPAESSLVSVTVICDSGALSDALSTACFVLGREKGEKLLDAFGAEGIFIDNESNVFVTQGIRDRFSLEGDKYTLAGEKK